MKRLEYKIANLIDPDKIRSTNFHYALAEIIHKTLSKNKFRSKIEKDFGVKISFNDKSMTIDCLDGNIYLNDKDDIKVVGKLTDFKSQNRLSDAYYCAKVNYNKIIDKITKLVVRNDDLLLDLRGQKIASPVIPFQIYTVKTGDTLWGISEKYFNDGSKFRDILAANRNIIHDPNLIYPGQILVIPSKIGISIKDLRTYANNTLDLRSNILDLRGKNSIQLSKRKNILQKAKKIINVVISYLK